IRLKLIDVFERRITLAPAGSRYVALSYVWGQCHVLRSTQSNREQLQQTGALDQLPPAAIVQDAMQLVKSIGERYLWVDSLCICQNDIREKSYYITRMDFIYSQALLTIVAASSTNAMDPLPGVQPNSRFPQRSEKIEGVRLVRRSTGLSDPLLASVYSSRAWTYQELILSKRCLVLMNQEAFLTC
ncbi:HET-domain-containing protein, partial [Polyplosphaeria fusca]